MKPALPLCFARWFGGLLMLAVVDGRADVNSWINPTGGNWDDASSWSLGTRPGSSQSIMITNSGWKAVAINPSTPVNFPGSMTAGSLTIAGPTNTENTLLLNYFGVNTPLQVLNSCLIQTNGTLLNLGSRFEVDESGGGTLTIDGGTFTEDGGFTVANVPVNVNHGGILNATNAALTLGSVTLGSTEASGSLNQDGGSLLAQQLILENGTYTMPAGTLYAIGGTELRPNGTFNQTGGTNYGDITMNGGHYNLTSGKVRGNLFSVVGGMDQPGNFLMNGGVLDMLEIDWGDKDGWYLSGYLRHGTVRCDSFNITGTSYVYVEVADVFVTNNVDLRDGATLETGFGHLHASTLAIHDASTFWQGGGIIPPPETNVISSGVTMDGGQFILNGATLETPYIGVGVNARIGQGGGRNLVHGVLSVTGKYEVVGGDLMTEGLYLRGSMLLWGPPIGSGTFSNSGLLDLGGSLGTGMSNAWGGQVLLSTNAVIDFIGNPAQARLNFASSSGVSWTPGALLVISNWNSGSTRLFFGTDASGLSASQLAQIQFSDPGGYAPGFYPAKILNTGEVVPGQGSSISGPVNSWITPGSGNWDQPTNWSLGVLPDSSQSVMIANSGFKTVTINATTPINSPGSMTVSNLTITSPTNSFNTLLLNFVAAGNPLVIGVDTNTPGSLLIDSSSAMVMYSSGLILNNLLGANNSRLGEFEVDGVFSQSNSSEVVAGFLDLSGRYNLDNGQVFIGSQFINGTFAHNGTFAQQSGSNYATLVTLTWGTYELDDGMLSARSLVLTNGAFYQFGGYNTNGGMTMTGTTNGFGNPVTSVYTLEAGTLETPSITMNQASFNHYAGTTRVGTLSISNAPGGYVINSGLLSVDQIQLSSDSFNDNGGTMAGTRNLTLENAYWNEWHAATQMGQLKLSGSTDSFLYLLSNSSVFLFADSSGVPWASGARLIIPNWSGSLNGGGSQQLFFGTSASGLTSQQLSQVQFVNPAGLPGGTYSARILSNGEVVPDQGSATSGPVNSWITPGSGNWDQPTNWSLGVLPDSSQSVMITNSVWKAVVINPSTPINFPGSMTVSNLTIRGATNTENTLLLNYVGTAVPLTVLNGLTLQDGAQILNFNSGLVVQGGTFMITNSDMIQDGGFVRATNGPIYLSGSEYDLTNGVFEGGTVALGYPVSAHFNQYGGSVIITNLSMSSYVAGTNSNGYSLYGGTLDLPGGMFLLGQSGGIGYFQAGGTNRTGQVTIEPNYGGFVSGFTLNGGLLADSGVELMPGYETPIAIEQNGGSHVITNKLFLLGGATHAISDPTVYHLNGGNLSAGTIELDADGGDTFFVQSNATTTAGKFYVHSLGYYSSFNTTVTLAGGSLSCSNYTTVDGGGRLNQSAGALVVSNLLDFGGSREPGGTLYPPIYGTYNFTGGTLTASNINISGILNIGDGTTNRISNPGFFNLSHLLTISNAVEQLGRFILAGTNATIDLAGSASRLSFANSSGETWAGGATLVVADWNGNVSGGGAEQVKFGTSQSGLTPAQLNQIQFRIGTNSYSAKILSTGEVVPDHAITPSVAYSQQGNNLVLSWPAGWTLQTATNAAGPYSNMPSATSPYTNDMTASPQRFFRLSQ